MLRTPTKFLAAFPSDDGFGQIIFGIQIHPTMAKKKPPVIFKGDTTTITHLGEKKGPSAICSSSLSQNYTKLKKP